MSKFHSPHVGNGQFDAVVPVAVSFGDHTCLKIRYNGKNISGEKPGTEKYKCTIEVDNNGDTNVLVTLKKYTRATDDDGSGTGTLAETLKFSAAGNDGTVVATLGALINELNKVDGIQCFVTDAPIGLSLASTNFVDLAATTIPSMPSYLHALTNDVSASKKQYKRIGMPELHHRNSIKLIDVDAIATGVVAGTLKVYQDDPESGAEAPVVSKTLVAAQTSYLGDDILNAITVQGPLIAEFGGSTFTALEAVVKIQQATV